MAEKISLFGRKIDVRYEMKIVILKEDGVFRVCFHVDNGRDEETLVLFETIHEEEAKVYCEELFNDIRNIL